MTHPDDLLADYVDGTLHDRDRADLDAHLRGCARCREEVRLAGAAKASLAELEDVPTPFGVTGPVVIEAGKRLERRGRTWDRVRWTAGLATAAVLVLVVVVNLDRGDQRNAAQPAAASAATGSAAEAGGAGPETAPVPFHGLERQPDVSYGEDGIRALADSASAAIRAAEKPAAQGAMASPTSGRSADASAAGPQRCIRRSGLPTDDARDVLIQLIQARFEGTPAYIAVFAESPRAGQPADHVVVWVVSTSDCRILTTASARVTPA